MLLIYSSLMFLTVILHFSNAEENTTIPCGPCSCSIREGVIYARCVGLGLSEIPPELPSITGWMDLTNNNLTLKQKQFSRFLDLRMLNLSGNQLDQINDGAFSGLDQLKHLRLDDNKLRYDKLYYTRAFQPLRKLHFLNISFNGHIASEVYVDYPDNALRYLKHLEVLHMDGLREKKFGYGFEHLKNLKEIDLSGVCSIVSLFKDTFTHVKHVTTLILRTCHISKIHPQSLEPLKQLSFLDVSNNKFIGLNGLRNLSYGFRTAPLRALYIDSIVREYSVCVILKEEFIRNLQNTPLEEFSANHNFIEIFEPDALPLFPKTLKSMSLRENKFTFGPYVKDIPLLTGLTEIDLSGKHRAHEFPAFKGSVAELANKIYKSRRAEECYMDCDVQVMHVLPSVVHTSYLGEVKIPVPPNLTHLTYSYSQLPYHLGQITIQPNILKYVDVSSNILSTWSGPVTGLEKLEILDLSNNLAKHIWPRFFHTFPGLKILNVSDNFMGMALYNDTDGIVFRNQSNLRILNLRSNYILSLHEKVFSGLKSLEELHLADNSIHPNLSLDIRHMKNLRRINCRNNQIRWVATEMIDALNQLTKNHSVSMDLSQNPIACTCYNLDFLSWMLKSDVRFGNRSEYFCLYSSGKNQSLENLQVVVDDLNSSCHNYFGLSLGVLAAVVLVTAIIISGIGYRYRWKLLYWYHAARLRYTKLTERADDVQFEFDAFVSFDEADREFVVNELRQKLETEGGIRLNIHQRDFKPGRPIATNIVDAIQNSRKTLLILTPDFVESYWCIFEFEMAKHESFNTGRDVLLLIMYKKIPNNDIPAEILYHIQSDSYLEYPQQGNKDVFWRTLTESLSR